MMKKFFIYLVFAVTAISGCTKKTDELFPEPADVRLQKALTAYKTSLIQAPGWKVFVYPQGLVSQGIEVGGLTYYMKFPDSNRVSMVSDFREDMAATAKESGYRIEALQLPSILFDTYSYIHVAADPDPDVSTSPTQAGGFGWGTDFEFGFKAAEPADTLVMRGLFNQSDAIMLPATQEEIDAAFSGRVAHIMQATDDFSASGPFLYFPGSDNATIGITFNMFLHRVNFNYISESSLATITAPFSHTTDGIHLKFPITVGGYTFQDLFWDDAQQRYYVNTGNGRADITNSTAPIFPFHTVLGKVISTINVPTTPLDGQSAEFTSIYNEIKSNLINSPYTLELADMDFIFDDASKTMALTVIVEQSGVEFECVYNYTYSINANNIANFTRTGMNGNAGLVVNEMSPFLDYIDDDSFKLDYYSAVSPPLGQFTSQNNPGFFFTGNLE